jgi:hypothetical protein
MREEHRKGRRRTRGSPDEASHDDGGAPASKVHGGWWRKWPMRSHLDLVCLGKRWRG